MADEDFSNHPISIRELRASKSGQGRDWSARDVLIDTLRLIDSGEIDVRFVVLVRIDEAGEGLYATNVTTNAPDTFATAGTLAKALHLVALDD